ncbi:MAG: ANTAR domain-containing protein [Oscillospiraceae bacterium]|nr:ANTAR domain-containing protein [Oscillospiraceae bacterium]
MKALVLCAAESTAEKLRELLNGAGITDSDSFCGAEARKKAVSREYDLVFSALPLTDEFGLDTVAYISMNTDAEQVVLIPSKVYDEAVSKTVGLNISLLPKNSPSSLILNTLRRTVTVKRAIDDEKRQRQALEKKISDDRLIYRAKCVLIEYLKLSEEEAHRILLKRAMDKRLPLKETALEVLKMYDAGNRQ